MCEALVDAFSSAGGADLVSQFAYPLPTMVIGRLLGIPVEDMDDFKHWSDEWLILLGQLGGLDRVVAAARSVVDFQLYVNAMVQARRTNPQDDLVSAVTIAAAELADPPSDAALVGLLMTVMFAGHETTTSLITNTVKLLAQHPDQLAAVQADRELIPAAVVESLRFDPPVPAMYRTATRDVELAGCALPAGAHIQLSFASANRDETRFSQPDRFDIRRTDAGNHLSFGKGIHFCIGAALAQLEARVGIDVLLDRLPGLSLAPDQTIVPTVSATVRGTERLEITWTS
jgi:cytochrome P450